MRRLPSEPMPETKEETATVVTFNDYGSARSRFLAVFVLSKLGG